MADFSEILGHQNIKEYMMGAIRSNQVSHAYIINGPDRSGKRMLSDVFAKALQCEDREHAPCNACRSCKQADGKNHPDIIYVEHEKPNVISVDEIRSRVVNDVEVKPYFGPHKIYIIDEAEKMNIQAQNALLKTIEEPPAYVVILLLTNNADKLLDTVQSRCVRLDLRPVPAKELTAYLKEHYQATDEAAELAAAFSDGAVGKAITLVTSEDFKELRQSVIRLVKEADEMDTTDMIRAVRETNDYKLTIGEYFDLLMVWYRDVLMYKATQEVDGLIFRDEIYEIRRQSDKSSYQNIEEILKGIETAKQRLSANVNFDLTMELLLMTIKEKNGS